MSTKPGVVPSWDTNQTVDGTHAFTATPGGAVTDGYQLHATPASGIENYWKNYVGQWCQYLSDGDINIAPVFVPSTKSITNGTNNDLNIDQSGSLSGVCLVSLTGGGASAKITGLASAVTLVEGKLIILRNDTSNPILLSVFDSGSSLSNRLVIDNMQSGTVSMPVNASIGFIYHAGVSYHKWVCAFASFDLGQPTSRTIDVNVSRSTNVTYLPSAGYTFKTTGAGAFNFVTSELGLVPGQIITGLKVLLNAADNPTAITLKRNDIAGGPTTIYTYNITTGSDATLHTVTSPVAASGIDPWWIEVSGTAGGGGSTEVYSVVIFYTGTDQD